MQVGHSSSHVFNYSLLNSFIYLFNLFILSIHPFVRPLHSSICSSFHSPVHSFIQSIYSFILLFFFSCTHSFIHSLIPSFIDLDGRVPGTPWRTLGWTWPSSWPRILRPSSPAWWDRTEPGHAATPSSVSSAPRPTLQRTTSDISGLTTVLIKIRILCLKNTSKFLSIKYYHPLESFFLEQTHLL
mgnify:CR=1 FL=1